jgi:hypothetical protein
MGAENLGILGKGGGGELKGRQGIFTVWRAWLTPGGRARDDVGSQLCGAGQGGIHQ